VIHLARWNHLLSQRLPGASLPFSAGSATAFDGALARCHGSDLLTLRLPFAHMPAVFFSTSPPFRKVNEACLLSDPSRLERLFCRAFQRLFILRLLLSELPLSSAPCWRTVATFYPLGNCDSLKPETVLSYLTRLGAVSFRTLSLSPFFAFTDGARTPPEELVNSASANMPCGFF